MNTKPRCFLGSHQLYKLTCFNHDSPGRPFPLTKALILYPLNSLEGALTYQLSAHVLRKVLIQNFSKGSVLEAVATAC